MLTERTRAARTRTRRSRTSGRAGLVGLICLVGCSGQIAGDGAEEDVRGSDGSSMGAGPSRPGRGDGSGTQAKPSPNAGSVGTPPADPALSPAVAGLRRLTEKQYRNAVADLLGVQVPAALGVEADDTGRHFAAIGGLDAVISRRGVEQYRTAALEAARLALADPPRRMALLGCAPTAATDPCIKRFVESFGRRAFRRRLTSDEVTRYTSLVASAAGATGDTNKGLEHAVVAFLQSPHFLFISELGEPDPARPTRLRLTSEEMAARLSFFLWSSIPDGALLDAAERGELLTVEGLAKETTRMLASPRVKEVALLFFREHLGLTKLSTVGKDAKAYPGAGPALFSAMGAEVDRLVEDLVFTRNGDAMDLLDWKLALPTGELATKVYKLPPSSAPVALPAETPRAGILTLPAVLSVYARTARSSPTLRGAFIRERILCEEVPPPPPDVNDSLPGDSGKAAPSTVAEQLALHRTSPACAGCHALFDGAGLALEAFDGIGAHRTSDAGKPISTAGEMDGKRFANAAELAAVLRADPRSTSCLVRELMHFATGRAHWEGEEPLVGNLTNRWKAKGNRFLALMHEIVVSDGFRYVASNR